MPQTQIIDYGMNGEGVAKIDGKIYLIPNSLIGETVEFDITSDHSNYAEARIKSIIIKSQNRLVPPCPYYEKCGGCALQHMTYEEQLKFKTILVEKTIKKIAKIKVDCQPTIVSSTPFYYRNKITYNSNSDSFGFYQENKSGFVNIDKCMLATEKISKICSFCFDFLKNHIKKWQNEKISVKNLVVRDIDNQTLIGVVTTKFVDLSEMYNYLSSVIDDFGLFEIVNTRKDSVVLSGKTIHIGGIKEIKTTALNINYSVDLLGFQQTNINVQNKIYEFVLNLIERNSTVINGFSGQGLLTALISQKAKFVTGIEIDKNSHISSEKLKKTNNIKNMKNICGDFFKEIKKLDTPDYIVLDPSKKGCGNKILEKIIHIPNIIYISCNPIALAKDINYLKQYYDIKLVQPFDMFPNTKSVETLILLKRKGEN